MEPPMLDQFFGFAYKGKSSTVKVVIRQVAPTAATKVVTSLAANFEAWNYFSKNLSDVDFLRTAWSSTSTKAEWMVS